MRKAAGSLQTGPDPRMSEWGNPADTSRSSRTEYIGAAKRTRGTETSKYPEEQKSTEIPLVAASERGPALKPGQS
jgi:hypothetical protein